MIILIKRFPASKVFCPLNKYLSVEPIKETKTDFGILVPEGTEINKNPYKLVKIIEVHSDSGLEKGMQVVVPAHMIEEVTFLGKTHYLVLESYVVGFYKNS
jgi:hypothetical protein